MIQVRSMYKRGAGVVVVAEIGPYFGVLTHPRDRVRRCVRSSDKMVRMFSTEQDAAEAVCFLERELFRLFRSPRVSALVECDYFPDSRGILWFPGSACEIGLMLCDAGLRPRRFQSIKAAMACAHDAFDLVVRPGAINWIASGYDKSRRSV